MMNHSLFKKTNFSKYCVLKRFDKNVDSILDKAFEEEQWKESEDPTVFEIFEIITATLDAAQNISSDILKNYRTMPCDNYEYLKNETTEWYSIIINNPTAYEYLEQDLSLNEIYGIIWSWWTDKERLQIARRGITSLIVYRNLIKENSTEKPTSGNTEINAQLCIFSQELLDLIYDECNGICWKSVAKNDLKNILNTGTGSLNILKNENERVRALFYRLSHLIDDNAVKSKWTANVLRTLNCKRINKSYNLDDMNASKNETFNIFLGKIHTKSSLSR